MYQPQQFGVEYAIEEIVVAQLKALGFEDSSWANNACPSFSRERPLDSDPNGTLCVNVWVDARIKGDREHPAEPRFTVDLREEGGGDECVSIITTDDFWNVLKMSRETLLMHKFHIIDPDVAFPVRKADLAAAHRILLDRKSVV